jgi:hypothetical protein
LKNGKYLYPSFIASLEECSLYLGVSFPILNLKKVKFLENLEKESSSKRKRMKKSVLKKTKFVKTNFWQPSSILKPF